MEFSEADVLLYCAVAPNSVVGTSMEGHVFFVYELGTEGFSYGIRKVVFGVLVKVVALGDVRDLPSSLIELDGRMVAR